MASKKKKAKLPNVKHTTMTLGQLFPAGWNPRTIDAAERETLTKSILEFGMVQEVVWNRRTKNIVGGNQRHGILMELYGPKHKVAVAVINVSEAKEKALGIQLNSRNSQGRFTEDVDSLLDELQMNPETEGLFEDLRLEEERIQAGRKKKKKGKRKRTETITCPHCDTQFEMK